MAEDRMVMEWDSEGKFTMRDAGPDDVGLPQADVVIHNDAGEVVYESKAPDDAPPLVLSAGYTPLDSSTRTFVEEGQVGDVAWRAVVELEEPGRIPREDHGHIVVLFGSDHDEGCGVNPCPMSAFGPFPTNEAAKEAAGRVPQGFKPHILRLWDRP